MVNKPRTSHESEQKSALGTIVHGTKNLVYAILLGGQVIATGLSGPASISVLTSKGGIIEKTQNGIAFPQKVYEFLEKIPENTERYNEYNKFLLNNNEIGDYLSDIDFLRKEGRHAIIESQKQLELIETGVKNVTHFPGNTLVAAILTLLFYLSLAQACKSLRLQDKDALSDKFRKYAWRKLFKHESEQVDDFEVITDTLYNELGLTETEAESLLETLLRRIKRRNQ